MTNFENSILEALKAGKTVDELASEYSKALNEAVKIKEAEDAKAKASAKKTEDMDVILDMIDEYIVNYYPEYKDMTGKIESKDMIEFLDEMFPLVKELEDAVKDLGDVLGVGFNCSCDKHKTEEKKKSIDPDKSLKDFMKKMGW